MYYHVYQAVNGNIVHITTMQSKAAVIGLVSQNKARGFFFIEASKKRIDKWYVLNRSTWLVPGDNGLVRLRVSKYSNGRPTTN